MTADFPGGKKGMSMVGEQRRNMNRDTGKASDLREKNFYPFRCPETGCHKTHFSIPDPRMQLLKLPPGCSYCGQKENLVCYLIHDKAARIHIRIYCETCRKESAKIIYGIYRICERCGWEGEFFIEFREGQA
jgi:hypothetical protein